MGLHRQEVIDVFRKGKFELPVLMGIKLKRNENDE